MQSVLVGLGKNVLGNKKCITIYELETFYGNVSHLLHFSLAFARPRDDRPTYLYILIALTLTMLNFNSVSYLEQCRNLDTFRSKLFNIPLIATSRTKYL